MAFLTPDWSVDVASDTLNTKLFGKVGKCKTNQRITESPPTKRKRTKRKTKVCTGSSIPENSEVIEKRNCQYRNNTSLKRKRDGHNESVFERIPKRFKTANSDIAETGKQNKKERKKKFVTSNEYGKNNRDSDDRILKGKKFDKKVIKNVNNSGKKTVKQEKFQDNSATMHNLVNNMTSSKKLEDTPSICNVRKHRGKDRPLRERMLEKLKASRFRYLNEHIYTNTSTEALNYFKTDKASYEAYHEGYKQQLARWPMNPVDKVIKSLKRKSEQLIIADFGCGDAKLARSLPHKVHSFDLIALSEEVTPCDMAHTPLAPESVDIVVFCLSLMGTNLSDYLLEANRVLKSGGHMKIVEVESRFSSVNVFIEQLRKFGFKNIESDLSNDLFYFLDFKKISIPVKKNKLPSINLKPCLYKKR